MTQTASRPTTTVRMLTSILEPTSGWAKIDGHSVLTEPEMVRAKVGVLTEQHGLYERMKAIEYLDFFGRIYRMSAADRKARSRQLMERFDLTFALDKRLGDYSKGMKQKLALVPDEFMSGWKQCFMAVTSIDRENNESDASNVLRFILSDKGWVQQP